MTDANGLEYVVQRRLSGPGHGAVSLIRREPVTSGGGLRGRFHHHEMPGTAVYTRSFTPLREPGKLERYAAELELVARHANAGTLGCFVEARSEDAIVRVRLFERWFDGDRLHCEELADHRFDPAADTSLVSAAEVVAELQDWAQRRNDERDLHDAEARAVAQDRAQRTLDQRSAARELAQILASTAALT